MKSYPRTRVTAESVREAVACIILRDVTDPRVGFVTVTGAEVSPDLRHADIFVTAHGGEDRYREAMAGLESAKGRIRAELGEAVRMKYVPELHFRIDPSVDNAMRITELLREERKREEALEREAAASAEEGDDA